MTFDLRKFAKDVGVNQTTIGEVLGGIDQSQVSFMMNGRRRVLPSHIEMLRKEFGDVVDNYITGNKELVAHIATMQPYPVGQVEEQQKPAPAMPVLVPQSVVRKPSIDVMEWVAEAKEERDRHAFNIMSILSGARCVIQMNNNAMMPTLYQNEYVFLRPFSDGVEVIDGEIYGVETRRYGILLRHLYAEEDTILTRPKNTFEFADIRIRRDEVIRFYHIIFHGSPVLSSIPDTTAGTLEQLHMQNDQINSLITQLDKSGDRVDKLIDMMAKK